MGLCHPKKRLVSTPLNIVRSLAAGTCEREAQGTYNCNIESAPVPSDASSQELNVLRQDFARVTLNQMSAIQESQRTERGEKKMFDFCFGPSIAPPFPLVNQAFLSNMPSDDSAVCNLRIIAISDV